MQHIGTLDEAFAWLDQVGGTLFQLGDSNSGAGGWAGYNVEYALPELRTIWTEGG